MSAQETIVLIGGDSPDAPMAWARVANDDGVVLDHGLVHENAPPKAAPANTVLIVPGADAQVMLLDLAARSEAQARAGAAIAFEGVLSHATDMHYAVGAAIDEAAGTRLAAAMSSARLGAWLARCTQAGADPHAVYLDFMVWPVAAGEIEIVLGADRAIVAAGPAGGFSIEPALAQGLFARWLSQSGRNFSHVRVYGGDAQAWAGLIGAGGPQVRTAGDIDLFEKLSAAAVFPPAHAPNLRQGAFGAKAPAASPWRIWRFAAGLAMLALMLQVFSLFYQGINDARAARQVTAQAQTDFLAARPDVGRVVNLRAQVSALANAMTQSRDQPVLSASQPLVAVLQAHALVRVEAIRHNAPGRKVMVEISAPRAELLEPVVTELGARGLSLETGAMEQRAGRYIMALTLESP